MNPKIAVLWLWAFIALLGFTGFLVSTRRASQSRARKELTQKLNTYALLVERITNIAREGSAVDPSAQLILIEINHTLKPEEAPL